MKLKRMAMTVKSPKQASWIATPILEGLKSASQEVV
jgi:hypothetical protein